MWGAERTPWHQGVQESKAEGYLNTVNNAPTRLSALPYRQPLLLRLLKVLVRGKFSVGGCCLNRACTVRPFAYSVSGRSTLPESELPWLVAGLPVYYHRSNGDRVSATVVDPSSRGGRRVSIRYELGGEEVLYEHAPEERLEFAIVTAESPDSPQPVHHEAPMDALLEPQLPEVEAKAPRIDDHEPKCCGG